MARKTQQDPVNTFLDSLFKGIWWLISYPFRGKAQSGALAKAKAEFQGHWRAIESTAQAGDWRQAVMSADILLDKALQVHRVPGNTLGERLKASANSLSKATLDQAWNAHKVRNRLAHELHYVITPAEGRQALNDFKAVLQKVGLL